MNEVTDVILMVGDKDCQNLKNWEVKSALDSLNEWLETQGYSPLVSPDDSSLPACWYGGNRRFGATLYLGAFAYLPKDDLFEKIAELEWIEPESLQVLVKEPTDRFFAAYQYGQIMSFGHRIR